MCYKANEREFSIGMYMYSFRAISDSTMRISEVNRTLDQTLYMSYLKHDLHTNYTQPHSTLNETYYPSNASQTKQLGQPRCLSLSMC